MTNFFSEKVFKYITTIIKIAITFVITFLITLIFPSLLFKDVIWLLFYWILTFQTIFISTCYNLI